MNSSASGSRNQKGDRTRRSWTIREDDFLLVTIHELVAHGWKADNGFRGGYLGKLEEAMNTQFPGCGIKGTPHIVSKLAAWKKDYNSLNNILKRSGMGFNDHGNFRIDCDDDQWDQIAKADKHARNMRDKSWPRFEIWKEIFGKDRANGDGSELIMDVVNGLYSNEKQASNGDDEDINLSALRTSLQMTHCLILSLTLMLLKGATRPPKTHMSHMQTRKKQPGTKQLMDCWICLAKCMRTPVSGFKA
ncbi:uncharacterized protein LOC125223433 isoform X2 [Salvia hispanica]|nr:uncharacterized protein LOC125223433 isoform X2 [Salvia hispanica]